MLKSKIEKFFETHNGSRICQGDVLRDLKFSYLQNREEAVGGSFQYAVVATQDCDLEQYQSKRQDVIYGDIFNQYIPNILMLPSFPADILRSGDHLASLYNYKQDRINTDRWKVLCANKNERYHFITGDSNLQIPDLVCDFKIFFTINFDMVFDTYKESYLGTINELFRENFSQRFTNYLSRIGLPVMYESNRE